MFVLDSKLAEDSFELGRFAVCRLLLIDDATYPWFVLVPERKDIIELHQLTAEDQHAVMDEVTHLSSVLSKIFQADKMNVAALGNLVPQLHLHVIVRHHTDPTWPRPIWGAAAGRSYEATEVHRIRDVLFPALKNFQPA